MVQKIHSGGVIWVPSGPPSADIVLIFFRQSVQSIYIGVLALGGMLAGFILWQFYILSYNIAEKIRKSYVKKFQPPTPVQNLRNHLQASYVLSIYILYIGRKLYKAKFTLETNF